MKYSDILQKAKQLNGFGWVLRPYQNRLGVFSLLLIFTSLITLWLVNILTFQYKVTYFDELRGIYPPIFSHPGEVDEQLIPVNVDRREEHFMEGLTVCIGDSRGIGVRPIETGVRSLAIESLAEQNIRYPQSEQAGVWLSNELYEVIFGRPYNALQDSKKLINLYKNNGAYFNLKTCQSDAKMNSYPILGVLPLHSNARWLVLRYQDVEPLNMAIRLAQVDVFYSKPHNEREVFNAINTHAKVIYWIEQLPYHLKLILKKLQLGAFIFLTLTALMSLAFITNLYLMTQKSLQEGFYMMRFYGSNKSHLLRHAGIALSVFWLLMFSAALACAYAVLSVISKPLYDSFELFSFLASIPWYAYIITLLCTLVFPLVYILSHFYTRKFSQRWKDTQH
ncbi:hypothetical protein CXF85_11180 [Colwellia sp. 75C3]|uniref:hypothetical protein n=1 Tax=Colwellia sp. 75C3 TaxID=888425 RepID=UPI000C31DE22|nr:hypothetical protein [Colwellia sp. 75C3]PKG83285.1 hypothetical protein CXF85_11180 [Colwellia sp. 75C3]